MRDPITELRIPLLHPAIRQQMIAFVEAIEAKFNRTFRMIQGFRSFPEQDAIYAQGRTTLGKIVTYSPAGSSYHNYGLAADLCPFVLNSMTKLDWNFDFKQLRDIAIENGLQCGMDFTHPDMDHFEDKKGLNWRDMLHKYTTGDFIPNTHFINIP